MALCSERREHNETRMKAFDAFGGVNRVDFPVGLSDGRLQKIPRSSYFVYS